jgi:hypothetical protein
MLATVRKEIAETEEQLKTLHIVQRYYTSKLESIEVCPDSGSAGATHQQKAKSIGQAVSTTAPCDTSSDDALGASGIPEV